MRRLWDDNRTFWLYFALSILFWALVAFAGGNATKDGWGVHFQAGQAVLDALLLIPLWLNRLWARALLGAISCSLAILLAWMLFPPGGSAVGLLSIPLAMQCLLLLFGPMSQRPPVDG